MTVKSVFPYDSVELSTNGREVVILDQTQLPGQERFLNLTAAEQIHTLDICLEEYMGMFFTQDAEIVLDK